MRRLLAVAAWLALLPALAAAHVMPARQGTLVVRERRLYVALSLPAALFAAADDDRDGRLAPAEAAAHAELLQRLAATRVHLTNDGAPVRLTWARVEVERLDDDTSAAGRPAAHVLALLVGALDAAPGAIGLRVDALPAGETLRVRAQRDDRTEVVTLRADRAAQRLFAGAWRRALDGAALGAAHVLGGADHLLFLLTLVLAGAGWRWWAGTISAFTGAHAVVLVAAALGHAPGVPAAWTEVLIAATIVVMALRALRAGARHAAGPGREAALAALCGLVHGLGIAQATRALEPGARPDLVTLAAFNLGVEGAQLAAAGAMLAALAALATARPLLTRPTLVPRALAGGAGLAGLAWLAVRLPALG